MARTIWYAMGYHLPGGYHDDHDDHRAPAPDRHGRSGAAARIQDDGLSAARLGRDPQCACRPLPPYTRRRPFEEDQPKGQVNEKLRRFNV